MAQLSVRFRTHAVVDEETGETRANDQQRHAGDGERERLQGGGIGIRPLDQHRGNLESRHSGEMQTDDRDEEQPRRYELVAPEDPTRGEVQRQGGEYHRERDGGDQIRGAPRNDSLHAIRQHAGVVHGGNRQAHDAAAEDRGQPREATRRPDETESSADHGDEQRNGGQDGVEADRRAGLVREYRHEMRTPDRRSRGERRQEMPSRPLQSGGADRPLKQARDGPATGSADMAGVIRAV